MNFLRTFGVGIFILVFLTVNSEGSAQYLTGMFFYLAKSVFDGGLPGIIRTVRAGKAVPFVPELNRELQGEIPEMARSRARDVVNEMDSESRMRRLVRQLWPDLDCETDNTCKVPADTVLKSDSRENGASGSTSSSEEENIFASAEDTVGKYEEGAETNVEEMGEEEQFQDIPHYISSDERERRRERRRQNRMRERGPPPPPPPDYPPSDYPPSDYPPPDYPPPFHFQDNSMYHDEEEGAGPPPPGHPLGPPPPPPWMDRPFRPFDRTPPHFLNREKESKPIPVTPKRNPVSQDFQKFSKVFKPNPTTTTEKPKVISKRFLRILRQHPAVSIKVT